MPASLLNTSTYMRAIFDATSNPLWLLDADARIFDTNLSALAGLERATDLIIGQRLESVLGLTPQYAQQMMALFRQCKVQRRTETLEIFLTRPTQHWLALTLRPIFEDDGTFAFVMVEGQDITLTKQSLRRLETSQADLREARSDLRTSQKAHAETQRIAHSGNWSWEKFSNHFTWSPSLLEIFGLTSGEEKTRLEDFLAAIHPDDAPLFYKGFETLPSSDYYMRIVRPNGEIRFVHGTWYLQRNAQHEVIRAYGACQDITNQQDTENLLAAQIHQVSALNTIAQLIASSKDEATIYSNVITRLRALLEIDSMAVFLRASSQLTIQHYNQPDAEVSQSPEFPTLPIIRDVWESGHPLLLQTDTDEQYPLLQPALENLLHYAPRSVLIVPLWWQQMRIGVWAIFHPDGDQFSEEDLHLVQTTAVWLTISLINLRLLEVQRQARETAEQQHERMQALMRGIVVAQETERQRVARELHDEAGQALVALKMQLTLVKRRSDMQESNPILEEAIALTSETMENIRRLAYNLHPPSLDQLGLTDTLRGLCRDYTRRSEVQVVYVGNEISTLSREATLTLYRFVQEALTNVVKHAAATRAVLQVTEDMEMITLAVTDNGRGFEPDTHDYGMGVKGIRERIELLQGHYEIRSAVGEGTTVTVQIPLKSAK